MDARKILCNIKLRDLRVDFDRFRVISGKITAVKRHARPLRASIRIQDLLPVAAHADDISKVLKINVVAPVRAEPLRQLDWLQLLCRGIHKLAVLGVDDVVRRFAALSDQRAHAQCASRQRRHGKHRRDRPFQSRMLSAHPFFLQLLRRSAVRTYGGVRRDLRAAVEAEHHLDRLRLLRIRKPRAAAGAELCFRREGRPAGRTGLLVFHIRTPFPLSFHSYHTTPPAALQAGSAIRQTLYGQNCHTCRVLSKNVTLVRILSVAGSPRPL